MQALTKLIDVFYPPFRRIMPLQTFRYAACGGANTLLGLATYFISFHYLFTAENFDAGFMVFKPHNAALFLSFCVSFVIGFLLNKYVVFVTSNLRGRIQLLRYFIAFFLNLVINYFLLKLFVEVMKVEPFVAQLTTTVIIVTISYLTQKHFTFRTGRQ